ncbi:MAG TPA: TIGR01906 family membrane protein [Clostridiales bacterium]|nr:TIGR01906 family membrane protein [Clostridiales bacterium]
MVKAVYPCTIVGTICSVLIVLILILTSIELVAFDMDFYLEQYHKNNTTYVTGVTTDELLDFTDALLLYLKGERTDLYIKRSDGGYVFSEREIEHMKDVRQLFIYGLLLRNTSLLIVIILIPIMAFIHDKMWAKYFSYTFMGVFVVILLVALFIGISIIRDFDIMWDKFHHILFTNDLWLLDPDNDILIMMMPEEFFINMIKIIAEYFFAGMGILFMVFLFLFRRYKKID